MRKDALILTGTAAFATALAFLFWNELRDSNKLIAKLQQQLDAQPAPANGSPMRLPGADAEPRPAVTSSTATTSLVAQAESGDAVQRELTPKQSGCDEATIARARQSAATTISSWAADLQLTPDETQRITEARQSQAAARLRCASSIGEKIDPQQLHTQFLAALGPARLEQLVDLNASRLTQNNLSALEKQLDKTGVPLNEEQLRLLGPIFLEENRRSQREAIRTFVSPEPRAQVAHEEAALKLAEERLERIRYAAQAVLRPEQLAQLRDNAASEIDLRRSNVKAMREAMELGRDFQAPPLPSMVRPLR